MNQPKVLNKIKEMKFNFENECSARMYDEFLNCNSYLYNMEEKVNSESISSDGEFNEFNYFNLVHETSEPLVEKKYQ